MELNRRAWTLCQHALEHADTLRVAAVEVGGARLIDFGIDAPGGLSAGCLLAKICLGGLAEVILTAASGDPEIAQAAVQVRTDAPVLACLGGQFAGWPVQVGEYMAMGSGPMRMVRGREEILTDLRLAEPGAAQVVGVLETEALPTAEIVRYVAEQCAVDAPAVTLCVAPVTSLAGTIQVVARSVETAMHKLHAVGMDPGCVVSAWGTAPLPPPATSMIDGIGRTNDAILYGGEVTLWVDVDQDQIDALGPRVPSLSSRDHGRPFAELFKDYGYDFYKVDPHLFSPAVVTFVNLRSGLARSFGQRWPEVLRRSFGMDSAGVAGS